MSPALQRRIAAALRACNQMVASELGRTQDVSERLRRLPRRKKRKARPSLVTVKSPAPAKLGALKAYRREHPRASLREAAQAVGFKSD
jgi:hypothetical protein